MALIKWIKKFFTMKKAEAVIDDVKQTAEEAIEEVKERGEEKIAHLEKTGKDKLDKLLAKLSGKGK